MSKNKAKREMENYKSKAEQNKQYNNQETEKKLNSYSNKNDENKQDCD